MRLALEGPVAGQSLRAAREDHTKKHRPDQGAAPSRLRATAGPGAGPIRGQWNVSGCRSVVGQGDGEIGAGGAGIGAARISARQIEGQLAVHQISGG